MMRELHESVAHTAKKMIIKESESFRLRLEKFECLNPKGLYSIDLINESLNAKGEVKDSSIYNFFMTAEELKSLSSALLA
jgi:hypothetical protein